MKSLTNKLEFGAGTSTGTFFYDLVAHRNLEWAKVIFFGLFICLLIWTVLSLVKDKRVPAAFIVGAPLPLHRRKRAYRRRTL